MPAAQLLAPEQVTLQTPVPHRTWPAQVPGPSQVTVQAETFPHSTPMAHASEPVQRTSHGRPAGHATAASLHAPAVAHSIMQVSPAQRVHAVGHTTAASIRSGSAMHHPLMQTRPIAQSAGRVHRKSSERESMVHPDIVAAASATVSPTAAAAVITAAIEAFTSAPSPPAHRGRGRAAASP
jgi:hypothetical protein